MNNQRFSPYIGVTGIMSSAEYLAVHQMFCYACNKYCGKRTTWPNLMCGVLVSSKTLAGQTNKYPHRYPKVETLESIFGSSMAANEELPFKTLNLIHYHADHIDLLADDVGKLVDLAGPNLTGFQFNMYWPEIEVIQAIRKAHPELYLLIQIGNQALRAMGWDPENIREKVLGYLLQEDHFLINAILLDPSGGKGELFSLVHTLRLVEELKTLNLDLGVAGGLSDVTLPLVRPIVDVCPDISIDAEGRLRDAIDDDLDQFEVSNYIEAAVSQLYAH